MKNRLSDGLRRSILIGFSIMLLFAVVFTQLPFRAQGRFIEVVTLGEWPMEWAVRRQFGKKQPEFGSIADFVNEAPSLTGLTFTPAGVRTSEYDGGVEVGNADEANILQAIVSIDAHAVVVREDSVSVLLGFEDRGETTFDVAYIYPLRQLDQSDCESISSIGRPKIGMCVFQLSSHWYAHYQWYPTDVDELQKALDELKPDQAPP